MNINYNNFSKNASNTQISRRYKFQYEDEKELFMMLYKNYN